ncbi:MAG: (2Fe-2S)-binding protein [Ruminococcaceae bacterium]|nr:(2Fe-2S)-binding protein [Oscillospiraceae bacterium]
MEKHITQYQTVRFTLNGREVERTVDVRASLTDMLRNDYRMTSVKKGCEVGECGACTVIIDGEAFNSCIYLAVWAEGKHITTLEGLLGPNGELSDIQQAFVEEAAIQCGFCTPGFILTAWEILESGREYADDELRKLLSGHLCRCTGYENILRAVKKTMYRRLGKELPR